MDGRGRVFDATGGAAGSFSLLDACLPACRPAFSFAHHPGPSSFCLRQALELGKVVQDYAGQQGVSLPGMGKERTMNDDMPGAFGRPQSSGGGGLFEKVSSALNGGSADGFGGNNRGFGSGNGFGAAAATAATAAGFGGAAHAAAAGQRGGDQQRQGRFGRSSSFSESQRGGSFPPHQQQQQQAAGFGQPGFAPTTPQGFGPTAPMGFGTPGTFGPPTPQLTPSFSQPGAPAGFNNQAYPPAYSVMDPPFGFSGAMTTQGQPNWGGSQLGGWGGAQQQPQYDSRGFAKEMAPGFGASGGGGWGSAAGMAAGGLAAAGLGAGLASTYNQAFGSGSGGSGGPYGFPTGGYTNPGMAYGGPPGPPKGGKGKKKGGGKGKQDKSAVVTEAPPTGPTPLEGWLHVPQGYELPDGIPKGLEVGEVFLFFGFRWFARSFGPVSLPVFGSSFGSGSGSGFVDFLWFF